MMPTRVVMSFWGWTRARAVVRGMASGSCVWLTRDFVFEVV